MSEELWCDDRLVAREVRRARTRRERSRGLLGTRTLPPGHALLLEPARQIHTFGMAFPIDVALCDATGEICHLSLGVAPWRVTRVVWRARFAVEMAAGGLRGLAPGRRLEIRRSVDDQRRSSNPVS